jgi:hypothetical protein
MSALAGFFFLGDTLTPMLAQADVRENAEEILNDMSGDIEAYAKANAPWSDITGDARAGLTADVFTDGDAIVLQLYHIVDYGVWLETIQAGKFAIIMPTLEHFSGEAMRRCHAVETGFDEGGVSE